MLYDTVAVYPLDEDKKVSVLVEELKEIFSAFGHILSIHVRSDKKPIRNTYGRTAFIKFSYAGMADNAVGFLHNKKYENFALRGSSFFVL